MNRKKILAAILAATLVGSPIISSISYADSSSSEDYSDSSYESNAKIQKFLAWEQKIIAYMTKDFKSVAMTLQSIDARKAYSNEFIDIRDNIQNVFADAKYSYDYDLPDYIANLKKEIEAYKNLRKEILSLSGGSVNPFALGADEVTSVENDTIDFQKTLTEAIRKAIDSYDTSDIKETGKMNLSAEGSFGKVDISIEKYTKLLSILTASEEADVVAHGTFSINMPGSYEYNDTTGDYEQGTGKTVTGDMSIDVSVKMIGQDVYLSLQDYSLHTNLTGTDASDLNAMLKEVSSFKGKTMKISLPASDLKASNMNQGELLAQVKKMLDVLDTKSLLTPLKKIGDVYTMTLKDDTLISLAAVYNQTIDAQDIKQAKQDMRKMPLLYSVSNGKKMFFVNIHDKDAVGMISLTKQDNAYSFLVDVRNPTDATEVFHLLIAKDFAEAKLTSKEFNMNMSYKDKTLVLTAEASGQNLQIQWPLSEENTNINFTFNGTKVGNITCTKLGDTYTYDVLFESKLVEMLSKFHMSGDTTITHGSFPIVAPKDFTLQSVDTLFQSY